jgi:hypothetical protein
MCGIAFGRRRKSGQQFRRASDTDDEDAFSGRVKRTGVADLSHTKQSADSCDDIMRRRPAWLVNDEDSM